MRKNNYHDLDHLANTWSAKDAKQFQEKTRLFEEVDKDAWK